MVTGKLFMHAVMRKILIADDHSILRVVIKGVIQDMAFSSVIDEAGDGSQALAKIKSNNYDLAILDISMPGADGFDILRTIRDERLRCRTLIVSFYPERHYALKAFKLGAIGYISKCAPFAEIKNAIHMVADGTRYVPPGIAEEVTFDNLRDKMPHERLSQRELQVMLLLARGSSVTDIARDVIISDKTVSTYRSRILKKMDMRTNTELIIYAIHNGLII